MKNPVSKPITVSLPTLGLTFVESVHGPRFHMAERADPFHKVIYVLQGRIGCVEGPVTKPLQGGPGTALCVHAHTRHQLTDSEPSTLLLLCLTPDFLARDPALDQLWTRLTAGKPVTLHQGGNWSSRFEALWRAGVVEQTGDQPGREVALRAAAESILVGLARRPTGTPEDPAARRVAHVAQELAATFYETWSLDRACARARISRRHFSKLFRQQTGRTFLAHLTELRLNHAARLLVEHRNSVVGAAFSSGYGDLSHFYRLFRARFGHPPRSWLEKRRGTALPSEV